MQIDTLIITAAQTTTAPMQVLLFLILGFFITNAIVIFTSIHLSKKHYLIPIAVVLSILVFGGGLIYHKNTYPESYSSHLTCMYLLESNAETISHLTLVPRNGVGCTKVGTEVTRVKTDSYTKFYLDFEIPN